MRITEIEDRPTIESTLEFIKAAHEGQSYDGKPYWTHSVGVMKLLPAGSTEDEKMAALLHDTIEDTSVTAVTLRQMGYSNHVVSTVELLSNNVSKPAGVAYLEWIEKVILASGNKSAIKIKFADNKFNHDSKGSGITPEKKKSLQKRYVRSMEILKTGL